MDALPSPLRQALHQTFSSLHIRNYRLYFTAQLISVSGTWMQTVAQAWLVLHLTGSGVDLGLLVGLQFLPVLLFGPIGGLIADRFNKRRLLYLTQSADGILAAVLGILVVTRAVELWQVYLLAALLGLVNVFDNPARQTFVVEMVGKDDLPNAVSLNTVVMNASRVVGPAIGGLVIAFVGIGVCFLANAASYGAVLVALVLMRARELHPTTPIARAKGQIRAGWAYVAATPLLRNTLVAITVVGIFTYNFTVTLALLAKTTFHGGAGTYSTLTACMGAGAIAGGLFAAHRAHPTPRFLQMLALAFGLLLAGVALAPTVLIADVVIVGMGFTSVGFIATSNATLQLTTTPTMRGRVMALYAMAFLGTTPIGAPLVGWIAQMWSPRIALLTGAVATLLAAGLLAWRIHTADESPSPPSSDPPQPAPTVGADDGPPPELAAEVLEDTESMPR